MLLTLETRMEEDKGPALLLIQVDPVPLASMVHAVSSLEGWDCGAAFGSDSGGIHEHVTRRRWEGNSALAPMAVWIVLWVRFLNNQFPFLRDGYLIRLILCFIYLLYVCTAGGWYYIQDRVRGTKCGTGN